MKLVAHTFIVLVIATTGCDQSQSKSALSALEADNAKLMRELEDANKKTAEMDNRISAVESAWKQFEQSFESEKCQALTKNIAAIEQLAGQVAKDVESSASVLKKFQDLETEVLNFRDLSKKHASESADANQIGQLKDSMSRLESTVNSLKTSIGPATGSNINHRIQMLETSLQSLKTDVGLLRTKVR